MLAISAPKTPRSSAIDARIEAPKAPIGGEVWGEGVPLPAGGGSVPHPTGEGSGEGDA